MYRFCSIRSRQLEVFSDRLLAAAQGNANGQNNLAGMYENGQGMPPDSNEAMKWYKLAARGSLRLSSTWEECTQTDKERRRTTVRR